MRSGLRSTSIRPILRAGLSAEVSLTGRQTRVSAAFPLKANSLQQNGSAGEENLPKDACHPDNDRDRRACRKSPESGDGSGDSESDEFLISGGDREGRSHRDKA